MLSFENTKEVQVVMFLAGGGQVSEESIKQGVTLQSTIDNQKLVGFKPSHVEIAHPDSTHKNEDKLKTMSIVTIDFEVSGAAILPNAGADTSELGYKDEHIKLHLQIEKEEIIEASSGNHYEMDSKC